MAQNISKAQQEQQAARIERQELKAELAEQAANRPRRPVNRRRRITLIVFAVIAVLVGLVSAFTLLPSSTPAPGGVPVGSAAPTFTLPVYGGGGVGLVNLRAELGHPVLLNFWSESCIPCRAEMPYLERIYTRYASHGEFALLGINQADPNDDIAPFGREYHITYPLLFDPGGTVNAAYVVTAIPTTYFIDSRGMIRSVFVTQLSPKTMRQGMASVGIVIP
jgi:cytochrome c biogenesis protein CcmG, thiol:disulfide interchange protein DsbE